MATLRNILLILLCLFCGCASSENSKANGASVSSLKAIPSQGIPLIINLGDGIYKTTGWQGKEVTLSWGPIPDATGYILYWSTTPIIDFASATRVTLVSSSYNTYSHTDLQNGQTYYYKLTYVDASGNEVYTG